MLDRVKKVKNLGILYTPEEEVFNEIVKTASLICETPISLITLLDENKQWFKAKQGVDITETPLEIAFCTHTVEEEEGQMVIGDLREDIRFKDNPFVTNEPNVRSYLGISIKVKSGERIGTVCVFDDKKRQFSEKQVACLVTLANVAATLIEEKAKVKIIEEQNQTLQLLNKNLESFSYMVAHDFKAPVRTINSFSGLILNKKSANLDTDVEEYLGFIHQSTVGLGNLVDNLLKYSRQIQVKSDEFELFRLNSLIEEVIYTLDPNKEELQYYMNAKEMMVFSSRSIIRQVIQNVISNAIKYQDKDKEAQKLIITMDQTDNFYKIQFEDNGIGMSEERQREIFNLFAKDSRHEFSTGVGFSVVQELLKKISGEVKVESELAIGTNIEILIPIK